MIETLIRFEGPMHVADIGAAAIGTPAPYRPLLDRSLARLTAVDGDSRQAAGIAETYGDRARVLSIALGDGTRRVMHLASPGSGMSSLLRPDPRRLAFFNGFTHYGRVHATAEVDTLRMADVEALEDIDFLKMDVQGAELMILEHAGSALDRCVAIHLEASFVTLYEGQPTIGDIDRWMRAHGFEPHHMADLKRWGIAPLVRGGDIKAAFNQLLECDIVYMRGLVEPEALDERQLSNLLLIAAYVYASPDLVYHLGSELERRGLIPAGLSREFVGMTVRGAANAA